MAGPFMLPDFAERKGTLYLRSDHMNYGRAVLNSTWHQARQAEPKDYDINKAPKRDLKKATYDRLAHYTDDGFPQTTYQEHSQQVFTCKKDFTEQEPKHLVTAETVNDAVIDRDTGKPTSGHEAILPGHHPDHNKRHMETTYVASYGPPYPFTRHDDANDVDEAAERDRKMTAAFRRCQSQFGASDGRDRPGWNTWADESGVYANTHLKREVFQPTRTITFSYEPEEEAELAA